MEQLPNARRFSPAMVQQPGASDISVANIRFSNEAYFSVKVLFNKQNCGYWGTQNSTCCRAVILASPEELIRIMNQILCGGTRLLSEKEPNE